MRIDLRVSEQASYSCSGFCPSRGNQALRSLIGPLSKLLRTFSPLGIVEVSNRPIRKTPQNRVEQAIRSRNRSYMKIIKLKSHPKNCQIGMKAPKGSRSFGGNYKLGIADLDVVPSRRDSMPQRRAGKCIGLSGALPVSRGLSS